MDLPIKVVLTRPVVVDDQTYDCLFFDEPDVAIQIEYAEVEAGWSDPPSKADAARVNLFWISRLAGVTEAVAGKIKASDLDAVNAAVEVVLGLDVDEGAGAGGASGNAEPAK